MLDEMDLFFASGGNRGRETADDFQEDVVRLLRHNMQHNCNVSFLMAGTRHLLEATGRIGERLFQMPVQIEVGVLDRANAAELLTDPVQDLYSWSTAARDDVLHATGRHPYLLQAIGLEVFAYMQRRKLSVCTRAELEEVMEGRVLKHAEYFQFQVQPLRMVPHVLAVARAVAALTQEERRADVGAVRAYLQLHGEGGVNGTEVEADLAALQHDGLLTEWRHEFRFRLPVVGQYIVRMNERGEVE